MESGRASAIACSSVIAAPSVFLRSHASSPSTTSSRTLPRQQLPVGCTRVSLERRQRHRASVRTMYTGASDRLLIRVNRRGIQCSTRRSEAVSDMPAVGNPVVEVTLRRNGVASTKREGSAGLDGIDEFRGTNAGRAASTVVATLIGRATERDVAAATTGQRRDTSADCRAGE